MCDRCSSFGEIHGQRFSLGPAEDYGEVLTYTAEVLHEADPRGSISLPQTSEPMPIYTVIYIYISSNESIYLHITTDTFMTSHHNMLLRTSGSFWFRQAPAAEDWWTPQRLICLTLQGIEYDDLQLWSWNRLLMGCWMIIRFIGIANVVLDDIKWYCRYHQCKKSNNKNTQWVVV